jgi:phosphate acetyltransferase
MARSVYITALEPQSGKSLVALGLMEMLAARAGRVAFFRPVVAAADADPEIELMRARYSLEPAREEMFSVSEQEAARLIGDGQLQELEKRVVEAYRRLEERSDFVVCEGTDFTGAAPALDFDLNAQLANQLGAPVLVVVKGDRAAEETLSRVRVARESLAEKGCELLGVVVNRVAADRLDETRRALAAIDEETPVYVVGEDPELAHPTVGEVAGALGAKPLFDGSDGLHRPVRDVRVAATSVEHFLDDFPDGGLVIASGDRPDILMASLASSLSPDFPTIAGLVLTAGHPVSDSMRRLLEGAPFPVLEAPGRAFTTASAVPTVRTVISADNERKIAAALGVFEAGVDVQDLQERVALERPARMTPIMFEYELLERARAQPRHIVLPEGEDDRVLRAAEILMRRGVADLTILGNVKDVRARAAALGVDLGDAQVIDPVESPLRTELAVLYYELRKHKGITEELAFDVASDVNYFGTLMVQAGAADGMVSGAAHTTGDTIRPAFEVIKARKDVSVVSSVFFMCLPDRVLVYGDCAVNPKPSSEQLADIAISSAETASKFGVEPRVAMLSYSTGESAKGEDVDAVRRATELVRERAPELKVEGPIQYDAAVDASVAELKLPGSEVAGQANVFIFPDLDTGNIAYKAVQRSSGAVAVGPVLQGLRKPVNDLSRGCQVPDIISTVAITAIQAQG